MEKGMSHVEWWGVAGKTPARKRTASSIPLYGVRIADSPDVKPARMFYDALHERHGESRVFKRAGRGSAQPGSRMR